METRSISRTIAVVSLLFTLSSPAVFFAQVARGIITGLVQDPSGAVIPEANVTVTNEQTGIQVSTRSQATGVYQLLQLLPGNYSITVQAAGFKQLTIQGLKVYVGSTLTQDLTLEVGTVTETLKVTGHTSLVETVSGSVGATVSVSQVLEIPLQDRNVFNLVNLVPGAYLRPYGDAPQNSFYADVSIGGSRGQQATPLIDGISGTRGGANMQNVDLSPPVDSMLEFKVEVNNLSAEFPRTAGGLLNAVTKNGTNQLHGSLYEFVRNDKFDAAGWGADTKAPLRRNMFGFTVGGPIKKNRAFFFYNWDALRTRQPSVVTRSVGRPEWRTGNFSAATRLAAGQATVVPIYDPETGTGTFEYPRGTLQFPGNIIPASRLDPVAVKAMSYVPDPNRTPDNTFTQEGNWQMNRASLVRTDYHVARVDHEFSTNTKLFVRYILARPGTTQTPPLPGWGDGDPNLNVSERRRQNAALNVTHLFTPTFFLNYTMGVHRLYSVSGAPCCDAKWGQLFGIPNIPGDQFPAFNLGGGGTVPFTNVGASGVNVETSTNWNYVANFTKVSGGHTVKFGAQHDRMGGNRAGRSGGGTFSFDGHFTRGVNASGQAIANTGINLADLLLGRLNAVTVNRKPTFGIRLQGYGGYIQDDWRVSSRLTLNLGLRYDTVTPAHEVADRFFMFDPGVPSPLAGTGDIPAGAMGIMRFQNQDGNGKYLYKWNKLNFGPRLGFAWRVFGTNDTVVRGGAGVLFGLTPGMLYADTLNTPWSTTYSVSNPVPFRLRDGIPANALDLVPASERTPTYGMRGTRFQRDTMDFLPQDQPDPYSMNLNLTIQKQWSGLLLEAGYLGNLGRHSGTRMLNMNRIQTELLSRTDIPERLRRPFTVFAGNQAWVNNIYPAICVSNYHAMTLKIERRFQNGIGWVAAYTLSKWIDNGNFDSPTGSTWSDNRFPQNIYRMSDEKSLASNHIPHRLVLSPIVDLPFGKGRHWMNRGGVLNAVFGGWQLSALGALQSGSPIGSAVLNGARDILGDATTLGVLRPDLLRDPNAINQGRPAQGIRGIQWLDPAAFAVPAKFTYGNAARTLPGTLKPGIVNIDAMVAKNFQIAERLRAQFRWETFNLTNTPQWGTPVADLGRSNFGISSASGRRLMQLGLKLYW